MHCAISIGGCKHDGGSLQARQWLSSSKTVALFKQESHTIKVRETRRFAEAMQRTSETSVRVIWLFEK